MHDAFLVRVVECTSDVAQDIHDLPHGHRPRAHESHTERLTLHERHRIKGESVHLTRAQDWDDVRVLQACGELDLAPEAFDVDAGSEVGREDFHDDAPPESALLRDEDTAHAAAGQLALDDVGAGEGGLEVLAELGGHAPN